MTCFDEEPDHQPSKEEWEAYEARKRQRKPHDPSHMYEDKFGIIHFCDGAQIVPSDPETYIVWTLCEKMDVPANQSFKSDYHVVDCIDCRRKAGLQL